MLVKWEQTIGTAFTSMNTDLGENPVNYFIAIMTTNGILDMQMGTSDGEVPYIMWHQ